MLAPLWQAAHRAASTYSSSLLLQRELGGRHARLQLVYPTLQLRDEVAHQPLLCDVSLLS